jgi:hypothetical protein
VFLVIAKLFELNQASFLDLKILSDLLGLNDLWEVVQLKIELVEHHLAFIDRFLLNF